MAFDGVHLPSYEKAVKLAPELTVYDQVTAAFVPFILNAEQLEILAIALTTKRLVVGKGRQIGCSTVFIFLLTLIAVMNPGIRLCVIGDEQDTADGLLATMKHWLTHPDHGMGVKLIVDNVKTLTLENGATIVGRTAISRAGGDELEKKKQSRAGRSKTFAVIYATEMAFWMNAQAVWTSLTGTATLNQRIFVDSTGAPGLTLFKAILEKGAERGKAKSERVYTRLFFGFESHRNYRLPANEISDERWKEMQKEHGFTDRESAAWWDWKLETDIHDVFRMLREYPIIMVHMFLFQEGQHVRVWADVAVRIDGWWNYYVEKFTEPIVAGVDIAAGVGKHGEPWGDGDASAIALLSQVTGKVLATYRCNVVDPVAFTKVVKDMHAKYTPVATLVETNGVGSGVWAGVKNLGQGKGMIAQWSSSDSKHSGELHVRRGRFRDAIEAKRVPVGGDLLTECRSSTVTLRGFEGHDDVISAASFAWMWIQTHPARSAAPALNRDEVFIAPNFESKKRKRF